MAQALFTRNFTVSVAVSVKVTVNTASMVPDFLTNRLGLEPILVCQCKLHDGCDGDGDGDGMCKPTFIQTELEWDQVLEE